MEKVMEADLGTIPYALYRGRLSLDELWTGYDEEDVGDSRFGVGSDRQDPVYMAGYPVVKKPAHCGFFVESVGYDYGMFSHGDGRCTVMDLSLKEEIKNYMPPMRVPSDIWNDLWMAECEGNEGSYLKFVVVATRGKAEQAGFCGWDMETGNPICICLQAPKMSTVMTRPITSNHWHTTNGPLIMYGTNYSVEIQLYDVRGGQHVHGWEMDSKLSSMKYCKPIAWVDGHKVSVTDNMGMSFWDVNSSSQKPCFQVSNNPSRIRAVSVRSNDYDCSRLCINSDISYAVDAIYSTNCNLYLVDMRCKSVVDIGIPYPCVKVHSLFSTGDMVILSCSSYEGSKKYQRVGKMEKILVFSLRQKKVLTEYTLPIFNPKVNSSRIIRVWGNSKYVLGIGKNGMFVFDQNGCKDEEGYFSKGGSVNRLRGIVGPEDLDAPTFDIMRSKVLVMSRNHNPICSRINC